MPVTQPSPNARAGERPRMAQQQRHEPDPRERRDLERRERRRRDRGRCSTASGTRRTGPAAPRRTATVDVGRAVRPDQRHVAHRPRSRLERRARRALATLHAPRLGRRALVIVAEQMEHAVDQQPVELARRASAARSAACRRAVSTEMTTSPSRPARRAARAFAPARTRARRSGGPCRASRGSAVHHGDRTPAASDSSASGSARRVEQPPRRGARAARASAGTRRPRVATTTHRPARSALTCRS